MHLHLVEAVFERIGDRDFHVRELALLAHGDEPGGELMRDGAAQDEAARLDARGTEPLRPIVASSIDQLQRHQGSIGAGDRFA